MEAKVQQAEQQIEDLKTRLTSLESGQHNLLFPQYSVLTITISGSSFEAKKEMLDVVCIAKE